MELLSAGEGVQTAEKPFTGITAVADVWKARHTQKNQKQDFASSQLLVGEDYLTEVKYNQEFLLELLK